MCQSKFLAEGNLYSENRRSFEEKTPLSHR